MNNSSSRTLEIKVLSAEDLRIGGRSVKKNAFAIVKVDPWNYHGTKVDPLGGSYPKWDEILEIILPVGATSLTLEVQCKTSSGDRLIGTGNLPLSDIIEDYTPEHYLRFLSYILKDTKGKRNGIINLSVRVKMPKQVRSSLGKPKVPDYAACSSNAVLKVAGYKSSLAQMIEIPIGERKFEGAVIGVPVWPPNHD
ncbi:hypothetical protein Pint_00360 [Pistacia integerrima]|uniref:Uncharacterized protein n=1 Tax=Pistacia integerrima TaxID=434235 RepID=A0ACC0ZJC0_9ROSI|nr:hypothetical protein Pint_00360 [Pistacia integerrima]